MERMTVKEFQAYSEAFARGEIPKKKPATKPKPKPKVKAQPKPKARAKRVTLDAMDAMERRLDRLERSTITTWAAAVAHIGKRDKVSMAEAGRRAAKEFKHLHPARQAK